jgi:hypothetical protein
MDALSRHAALVGTLLARHGASAAVAMVTAELLYKFHSFTLESLAFLVTWYVADVLIERPLRALRTGLQASHGRSGS